MAVGSPARGFSEAGWLGRTGGGPPPSPVGAVESGRLRRRLSGGRVLRPAGAAPPTRGAGDAPLCTGGAAASGSVAGGGRSGGWRPGTWLEMRSRDVPRLAGGRTSGELAIAGGARRSRRRPLAEAGTATTAGRIGAGTEIGRGRAPDQVGPGQERAAHDEDRQACERPPSSAPVPEPTSAAPGSRTRLRQERPRGASRIGGGTTPPRVRSGSTARSAGLARGSGSTMRETSRSSEAGSARCRSRSRAGRRRTCRANIGRCRPVERRAAAQQLVDEDAVPVDDAPLRGRKLRELFGRRVSRVTARRLARRELIAEAEPPEDRHVGPEELHAVGIVHDDVPRRQGKIQKTEIQRLPRAPRRSASRARAPGVARVEAPA